MARKPTARPPNEHLSYLARMAGQVDADTAMSGTRKTVIRKPIAQLMGEFQKEMTK